MTFARLYQSERNRLESSMGECTTWPPTHIAGLEMPLTTPNIMPAGGSLCG